MSWAIFVNVVVVFDPQGIGGRDAPMKDTKPVNTRRYTATFDIVNTTKGDSGRYRCIVRSERGLGVSSYGALVVKRESARINRANDGEHV